MKRVHSLVAALVFALGATLPVQAIPNLINYQGRLTDAAGQPQTGPVSLTFNLYAGAVGGTPLWGPQVFASTPLVDGYFNVILGNDASARAVGTAFSQLSPAYLEIQVGASPPITPRQQILSAPYAVTASNADKTAFTTVTKTGDYVMLGTEDLVYVNGSAGSFTLTLPSAAIAGPAPFYGQKPITIKRTDNTLASVITINGTIDGESDWKLHTKDEAYRIVRDGTEWKLLDHYTKTPFAPNAPLTITASSNPTKGVTVADYITWRREGSIALIRFNYQQVSAGSAGNGAYKFAMPAGLQMDTTRLQLDPGADVGDAASFPLDSSIGVLRGTTDSYTGAHAFAFASDLFGINYVFVNAATDTVRAYIVGSDPGEVYGLELTTPKVTMNGWLSVPIQGWKD